MHNIPRHHERRWLFILAGTLALIGLVGSAPSLAGSEGCISAVLEHSIRFPDGDLVPPGKLTLCQQRLSPVANLHKMFVDGMPVGFLVSRRSTNEAGGDHPPEMFFDRGRDGQLELIGYALPRRNHSVAFRFHSAGSWSKPAKGNDWRRRDGLLVLAAVRD